MGILPMVPIGAFYITGRMPVARYKNEGDNMKQKIATILTGIALFVGMTAFAEKITIQADSARNSFDYSVIENAVNKLDYLNDGKTNSVYGLNLSLLG